MLAIGRIDANPINDNDVIIISFRPWAIASVLIERADFAELGALAAHRQAAWERQRAYVLAASPLHRRAWAGAAPPLRLEDLPALPLIDKEILRASQQASPPFGDYLAADATRIARIHRTSGTTGVAMNLALSARDAEETAIVGARAHSASGLGPGHRVVHCLNYRLWMGGFTDHATLEATGAAVVRFGVGETPLLIRTIRELGVTAISCTPSYPAVLGGSSPRFSRTSPRDLGLQLGLFGGEAGLDDPNFRRRIEAVWGMKPRNANYASRTCSAISPARPSTPRISFVGLDVLHPELIAPESGAPLPWREGERANSCSPILRASASRWSASAPGTSSCSRKPAAHRAADRAALSRRRPQRRDGGARGITLSRAGRGIHRHDALSGEYRIASRRGPNERCRWGGARRGVPQPGVRPRRTVAAAFKHELGMRRG